MREVESRRRVGSVFEKGFEGKVVDVVVPSVAFSWGAVVAES